MSIDLPDVRGSAINWDGWMKNMLLVDKDTRLVVQGITGGQGTFHTGAMLKYGTKVVAGTSPGKRGEDFQEHGLAGGPSEPGLSLHTIQ